MNDEDSWYEIVKRFEKLGILLYDEETEKVCLKTTFLSKIMALFIAPKEHIQRLQSKNEDEDFRSAIVGYNKAIERMTSLNQISEYSGKILE